MVVITLVLNSCGSSSGGSESSGSSVFDQEEKSFLHTLFLTEYLWYDQVASSIDYALYNTSQEMIDGLKLNPPDQWSFAMTEKEYEDFANQETSGFGFGYTSDFILYLVRINAPAYGQLLRGDRILEVNGQSVTQDNLSAASNNLNVQTTFNVLRNNTQIAINVTPRPYAFNVSLGKVINQNGTNIAYLRYDSFTESSVAEFETIFSTFKAANVSELVIDLRYNGGGSIGVASALLDNISNSQPGARQVYLDWNANYKNHNSTYTFESADLSDGNELNMQRVIFLVTYNSASASELVISALKPYLGSSNVVTIGTSTHGKPVGMAGRIHNSTYYFLVNFFVKNTLDETTSFYGIPATCIAEDDISHVMGDPNETMLKTALHYISTNGSCL